ncbi:coiled-coil domain-containing protein 33 [Erpetoichthys calabaricus]|uniref:coiled-coil domain-containing protein 33 n=1 Tax=Erpetoichthys calabaricus TaxID=27687 RepID=UPI002234D30D|nr:coiled-coil domain-containing protein 33 [Erpetoichthys calabaricus]XP_051776575.1 coiled-coil domain-containing protein 33 [Erpetoichthys calabaricus]
MAKRSQGVRRKEKPQEGVMEKSQLKIEEKELDFEFEVINMQFNELGNYALRLTVENPLLDNAGEGVQLRVNDGDVLYSSTGTTDIIEQTDLEEIYTCLRHKFVFTLPKGFCKNDKNHDVRLKIEALRIPDNQIKNGVKAGEAFFAIYPRTNAPRINVNAGKNDELYHYSGIMALLRVQNDYLAMHCGRLAYTVKFHEARPPPVNGSSSSRMPSIMEESHSNGQSSKAPSPGPSAPQEPPVSPTTSQSEAEPGPSSSPVPQKALPEPQTSPVFSPPKSPPTKSNRRRSPEMPAEYLVDSVPSTPEQDQRQRRLPSEASLHLPSPQYTPVQSPEPLPSTHVMEIPPKRSDPTRAILINNWHVSRPGKEAITVILHGATNLPPLSDGAVPQPFATVSSGSDEKQKKSAQGVTHATLQPTHSPSWEEKVTVEVDDELVKDEDMVLNVADSRTKELLASYRLPVRLLHPFYHYHLELVQGHRSVPSGVRLYITVVRKGNIIPRQAGFSFTGFEVLLLALEKPLKEPVGPLLTVARVVPEYESYKDTMLTRSPRAAGIAVNTLNFPIRHDAPLQVSHISTQGYPQVSQAGFPQEQPVWNHSFLFHGRDCATIFSGGAALVLEYYPITTVMNTVSWHIRSPLGFSILPLSEDVYRKLMAESSQRGVRVEHLPVEGSTLQTTSSGTPSVGIILRLIGSERPDSLLASSNPSLLPTLDSKPLSDRGDSPEPILPQSRLDSDDSPPIPFLGDSSPLPRTSRIQSLLQRGTFDLPSYDALEEILPEYEYLFRVHPAAQDPHYGRRHPHRTEPKQPDKSKVTESTERSQSPPRRTHSPKRDYVGQNQVTDVAEHEAVELENYRTAMRKMAEDIIALRKHVGSLESHNSRLRSELSLHQDLGRTLLDDMDIDVMTKAEIADRITSLKVKLATETSEVKAQKDKIQQLQNELIRKNDREKELLNLQRAHQQQQMVLQKYHERLARVKGLESTIRQQEKVIEKMEKVLDTKLKEKKKGLSETSKKLKGNEENIWKEVESALAAENSRLRAELEKIRSQAVPTIIQLPPKQQDWFSDAEKLSLLAKLEKAQGRIESLEMQLEENARRWGREKQDLMTRLTEHDHGFARTSTMILHDFPLKNASDSLLNHNRHRKLDPLT